MSESRPARRRVAGERARARRPGTDPAGTDPTVIDPTGTDPTGTDPTGTEELTAPQVSAPEAPEQQVSDADGSEPAAETPAPDATGRRGWPFVVAAVLGVLLLAGAAASGVLAYRVQQDEAADTARGNASAAARSHAQKILSYDHRTLDADFAAAEKALTGSFKEQYAKTTDTVVRPSAQEYDVVVAAEVVASSVVRASADRVVVLLYVDQTTTSTRLEGPKVDLNRVRMTLTKDGSGDGNWLVSKLDAL